jgi:pSer/pThr/pTyr-binding forkhead associated (FHA) protein
MHAGQEPATDFVPLWLVLESGGLSVQLTEPDMVIGRHSTADVRLPLPDVSRRHCRFLFGQGSWKVIDLESLNGVYVNGEPVKESIVHDGDAVGIGGFHFRVKLAAARLSEKRAGLEAADHPAVLRQSLADRGNPQRKAS